MTCVSSSQFSIIGNGSPYGYFPGTRGLRQGDPLSPLLFVLVMEILSRLLHQLPKDTFRYHPYCANLNLSHLIFADDLLIFCRGDIHSVSAIKCSLDLFAPGSGLHANSTKTGLYLGGIHPDVAQDIINYTGFVRETFPFRYLGIPLNASRLTLDICAPLLDLISSKIHSWSTHLLSYAGRLQLVNSVIFGILNFWCSPFLLPTTLLNEISKLCRRFFWNYGLHDRKLIFLSWDRICKPKSEGGFNVKEMLSWNKALACKLIFKLINKKGVWAIWAQDQYLLSTTIWDVVKCQSDTWSWKNIKIGSVQDAALLFQSWTLSGRFVVSKAYDFFHSKRPTVSWHKTIWDSAVIPKHSVTSSRCPSYLF